MLPGSPSPYLINISCSFLYYRLMSTLNLSAYDSLCKGFGHTITRMSVIGEQIHFHRQQHQELCMALKVRNLELVGDWSRCIALHADNKPMPAIAELLRQAMQGFACQCGACPSCLGIGTRKLEEEGSCACMLEHMATA